MTNPIPQAAVDAAAERFDAGPGFCVRILARYALEAAMPHLRKQIAEEIRAEATKIRNAQLDAHRTIPDNVGHILAGYEHAARIAEKGPEQ